MPKKRKKIRSKSSPSENTVFFTRRRILSVLGITAAAIVGGGALFMNSTPVIADEVVVYKDPSCGCCGRWVSHMRRNGFAVVVHNIDDMDPIKRKAKIPDSMESCHTAFVGGYSVEGHVPASDIKRILVERPGIKGLAVPGMPSSAPGMDSSEREPYTVFAFDIKRKTTVFANY